MVIYLCFESIAYGAFHLRVKDLKFALYQGSRFLTSNVSSYTGNQGRLATAFSWRMDKRNVQTPLICKLATVFTLSMFQGAFVNIDLEKWADCLHRRAARTNPKGRKIRMYRFSAQSDFFAHRPWSSEESLNGP